MAPKQIFATTNGHFSPTPPKNETVLDYAPGSVEAVLVQQMMFEMSQQETEVCLKIGGESVKTGDLGEIRMPHDHQHLLGTFHKADEKCVEQAIQAALDAKAEWAAMPWQDRAAIFLRASELLASYMRPVLNAATMLNQSKTCIQAEIDSACELIDFLRFNVRFAEEIYAEQPNSTETEWNRTDYRPLEGFVYAVSPFNFTAIAGNLPTSAALMGNTVVWKPASTAMLSAHFIMTLLTEAGLPPGVINMVAGSGPMITKKVLSHPDFAGLHFTGSTEVFQSMWKTVGENVDRYKTYPRLVGETGGKDFVIAHKSAGPGELVTALIRGAFEYQGQKCSAASRAYIAQSVWDEIQAQLISETESIRMGDVRDFGNFIGAVIDEKSYDNIVSYIDRAHESEEAEILAGGIYDKKIGYYIRPTIILTQNPKYETMVEELFGPVLTIYVYPDEEFEETLHLCNETSPYALTGAIFAKDRQAVSTATSILNHAAGNFYINDRPTGAVVGRQPFGGGRASGTNDKAGSKLNLLRWTSPRTIKESFVPALSYEYPHMFEPASEESDIKIESAEAEE